MNKRFASIIALILVGLMLLGVLSVVVTSAGATTM